MADINVERKGPSIWPWIIGLIVLALLIWALAEMFGREDRAAQPGVAGDTVIVDTVPGVTAPADMEPGPGAMPGEPGAPAVGPVTPADTPAAPGRP